MGKNNALGRAFAVADAATEAGDVRLLAPLDGPLWPGASRSPVEVEQFVSSSSAAEIIATASSRPLIWAVKPLSPAIRVVNKVVRAVPGARVIVDFDDDDEALAREFAARSVRNRLRLHLANPLAPSRIRRSRQQAERLMHGFSYATNTLRDTLDLPAEVPSLWLPHVRRVARPLELRAVEDTVDVGFLGTVRSHKGVDMLLGLVAAEPRVRLHVFEGALPEWMRRRIPSSSLVEHAPDEPMSEVYSSVHVVLLAQGDSPGAQRQLPAKLLDAMQWGRPAIATPTPAISEVAGDAFVPFTAWHDSHALRDVVLSTAQRASQLGGAARRRFEDTASTEARAPDVRAFVELLLGGGESRASSLAAR